MNDSQLEMRPLGLLAVGGAILSLALSVTYFLSPLAIVVAFIALLLGGVSRSDPAIRRMGSVAIFLAVVAIALSCAMIKFADFQV